MKDKTVPHNLEAEQAVLGGILIEPESWFEIEGVLEESDFYNPLNRIIFSNIKEMKAQEKIVDVITLSNFLEKKKQLDKIGGPAFLGDLLESTPSSSVVKSYADIIREKSTLRKFLSLSRDLSGRAVSGDYENITTFKDTVESSILNVFDESNSSETETAPKLVKEAFERLTFKMENKGFFDGVRSGYETLDSKIGGFEAGEFIIIAARPSMGKTALGLNIALNAAASDKKVLFFSAEMSKASIFDRFLSIHSSVSLSDIKKGEVKDSDYPKLVNSAAEISDKSNLFINDTSAVSPYEVKAGARRIKSKFGLDLIIVDYLQLMSLKRKVENREREVAEISRSLKALGKELKVPVIGLSQLNRKVEDRANRRPMLSDLRESGSIEQDADKIMMIYREDYYEPEKTEIQGVSEIIVGKNRNGETGTVKLNWIPEYGQFKEFI